MSMNFRCDASKEIVPIRRDTIYENTCFFQRIYRVYVILNLGWGQRGVTLSDTARAVSRRLKVSKVLRVYGDQKQGEKNKM